MNISFSPNFLSRTDSEMKQPGNIQQLFTKKKDDAENGLPGDKLAKTQKNAMKKIIDQFKMDSATDTDLEERQLHREELAGKIVDMEKELKEIDQTFADYKEQFGITEEMAEEDYPEKYRQIAEDLNTRREMCLDELDTAQKADLREQHMVSEIKIERLKRHDMVDTQKQAEGMIKDAIKDSMKEFVDEGVEKAEENFEKAKEEAAKKKTEEEKAEEEIISSESETEQCKSELEKYIEEAHVIDEDAIGLVVDNIL